MALPATKAHSPLASPMPHSARIESIDFLRGLVMVIMAIDHSRTFLHSDFYRFNAEDLSKTTPVLFFTRWITHFCAPVFIFLTGLSAFLLLQKWQSRKRLFQFLISRGIFLILLELTLFRFCWQPDPAAFVQPYITLLVIWAIGISMIFLAFIIFLPYPLILVFGLLVLFLHNLLAGIHFPEGSALANWWTFLYKGGSAGFGKWQVFFLYPVLPYFGLISLGFCLGSIYRKGFPVERRKKILLLLGFSSILLFIVLRSFNLYGDPRPWKADARGIYSLMAFLRTTKYPVSLLFALMTLGPAMVLLAWIEPVRNAFTRFFVTIGSVPMFYYILHLIFFVLIGYISGFNAHSLAAVYVYFGVVVLALYGLCRWYSRFKFSHPEKAWLKFI